MALVVSAKPVLVSGFPAGTAAGFQDSFASIDAHHPPGHVYVFPTRHNGKQIARPAKTRHYYTVLLPVQNRRETPIIADAS
jgi:hypothetical protein